LKVKMKRSVYLPLSQIALSLNLAIGQSDPKAEKSIATIISCPLFRIPKWKEASKEKGASDENKEEEKNVHDEDERTEQHGKRLYWYSGRT